MSIKKATLIGAVVFSILTQAPVAKAQFNQVGACCFPDETCSIEVDVDCFGNGGTFVGGDCDPGLCDLANLGACCEVDGFCFDAFPQQCTDPAFQTFQGSGTTCAQTNCPIRIGACCEDEFTCFEDTFGECQLSGFGTYHGDGTFCDDVDCTQFPVVGACCHPDDSCLVIEESDCTLAGGTYQGDFVDCTSVGCGASSNGIGACCQGFSGCTEENVATCAALGGFHAGVGTTCASFDCNDAGRCCQNTGGCAMALINDCFNNLGGISWAGGVTCQQLPCPPVGACCDGASCFAFSQQSCEFDPTRNYMGDQTQCADVDCQACPGTGSCYAANGSPSCDDPACCTAVCATDPSCCSSGWTQACADLAATTCTVPVIAGPITNPGNCHEYLLLEQTIWPEAQETAQVLGGHLATINDMTENEWVRVNVANAGGTVRNVWIGLTDEAVEGVFVWASGEPVSYVNWATGEPNNLGEQDYVEMRGFSGEWNDAQKFTVFRPFAVVEVVPPTGGDCDCDGDVDGADYTCLADCLAGPNATPGPTVPLTTTHCLETFDFDGDGDVDLDDAAEFMARFGN